jgi:uncharacterized protein DUF481
MFNMRTILLFCLLSAALLTPLSAQETDVIYFTNGDRLTCEIKRLRSGVLRVEVDSIQDDLRIDWKRIERIESDKPFQIRLSGGETHIGEISTEGGSEAVTVSSGGVREELDHRRVIDVLPLQAGFGGKLDVDVDGGFSYTQGNKQVQYTANGKVELETPTYGLSATVNSLFSGQSDGSDTNRHSFTGHFTKFIQSRWGLHALGDFLISDQQKLDLRSILGGGVGYDLKNTYKMRLSVLGGAVWTREQYFPVTGIGIRDSLEAIIGGRFQAYSFKKINLETQFWLYPSLTESGRVRADSRTSLKVDLPHDLFWRFGLTLNLDNDPPQQVSGNDLVTTTTIGWEF